MPTDLHFAPLPHPVPPPVPALLALAAFSYEDRRDILPALSEAMALCGCWLLDRKPTSLTQMEFRFELQLHAIVELYAALIAAGLELTRGSHLELTALCTVSKHSGAPGGFGGLGSVVTVALEVTFLDEITLPAVMGTGTAHA